MFVTLESGVLTGDVLGYDRGTPTTEYTDAIIGNLGKRTETWTVRDVKPLVLPEARSRARLREGDVPRRRRSGRLRRVAALGVRARRIDDGAHPRHAAVAQDDLLAWHEGLPADRRLHGDRGSLPMPVHHQGGPGRPPRRGRAPAAHADLAVGIGGCTSRSCRSSTASSVSPATKGRTERRVRAVHAERPPRDRARPRGSWTPRPQLHRDRASAARPHRGRRGVGARALESLGISLPSVRTEDREDRRSRDRRRQQDISRSHHARRRSSSSPSWKPVSSAINTSAPSISYWVSSARARALRLRSSRRLGVEARRRSNGRDRDALRSNPRSPAGRRSSTDAPR